MWDVGCGMSDVGCGMLECGIVPDTERSRSVGWRMADCRMADLEFEPWNLELETLNLELMA